MPYLQHAIDDAPACGMLLDPARRRCQALFDGLA
jgi:hypothetical protein